MSAFLQHHLLGLLEYRHVLGALATSLDGLLVASAAVTTSDAELIAASLSGHSGDDYSVTTSAHGSLHVVRGGDMRLIVLAEPEADQGALREMMIASLAGIEESVRV